MTESNKPQGDSTIDTGDTVKHGPTGEEWVVAYVRDDRLSWCGWPEGEAALADCTLIEKASEPSRQKLLQDLANMSQYEGPDSRCRYARHRLGLPL